MHPVLQSAVAAVFVTLIVVMGAYASGEWARDEVDANLEEGHDTGTGSRTVCMAVTAMSAASTATSSSR